MVRCKERRDAHIVLMSFFIVYSLLSFLSVVSCMDPNEYKPEDPPQKIDPPAGPSAILPLQDTLFRCEHYCSVTLDWTEVDSAQGYEFQIDTSSSFSGSFPYQGQYPPTSFSAYCYPPVTTYFFRVRAYSDLWTWYTDWSEVRRFYLMPVQDDTIFPPN